ncbi:MAG: aerobic-type carbon monoxide dehydrogenase, small subunit CoxS/CutS-like protein [Deltaproteobacteria bacterium]|jgi:carbon-monoxide dehydrogenase small subunit|nr:aerobic-type carbon monoxide dehydrogenase, small subunit CoxS/CutS-like protein [Deltaproteobacteria bacterium]
MSVHVRIMVNGEWKEARVHPETTLLELLRETWGLTGTKQGCDEGDCGACTVLLDGQPVNSCLILAIRINGRQVTTIEGLGDSERLHPLQAAFVQHGALQCGFCGPGMLLSAKALLDSNPHPTRVEIQQALSGNLCRCTGYSKIIEAVLSASHMIKR